MGPRVVVLFRTVARAVRIWRQPGYRRGKMTTLCAAGVDIGRDHLDVGLAPNGGVFRTANSAPGIEALVRRLAGAGVERVVLESIGSYGARLVRALADAGFAGRRRRSQTGGGAAPR